MLPILHQISITCFTTSYAIALLIELLRLVGRRVPGRGLAELVMMAIGIFTHVAYLSLRATADIPGGGAGTADGQVIEAGRLATWTDFSLMVSLGLAICYFVLYLRRPDTVIGFFFLPAILGLIALAISVRHLPPFDRGEATAFWRNVHAISMMLGSAAVLFGFLAGAMYLVQSWRLKHKRAGSALRLPTLETLQNLNRRCLVISTVAVGVGLVSGVVMNLNRWGEIPWTNRGIMLSGVLFVWLASATMVEYFYAPASRGRKVAYLTLASFGFLVLAMSGVLTTPHGGAAHPAGVNAETVGDETSPADLPAPADRQRGDA
ncbi:cytochrome c biogenesis protein CcsA [Allorhodopirellula solitaria]|uniref:Cytochrome C assembly protein n=1 Tax=Allorhodopirellula solitaria TaxID=2527987 RepID=A0A5C5YG34_9BACT|nr:cytochrome c biogenesis protein CcsA [Allorhodopirellula solitaria]TWT74104.1 Cytochrome C assembly protein [Allorhodopirellula solitaria]